MLKSIQNPPVSPANVLMCRGRILEKQFVEEKVKQSGIGGACLRFSLCLNGLKEKGYEMIPRSHFLNRQQ